MLFCDFSVIREVFLVNCEHVFANASRLVVLGSGMAILEPEFIT